MGLRQIPKEKNVKTSSITPRPMTVPVNERGGAGKIILIVLAVIFALVLIVVGIVGYGIWRVSKAFHSDKNGQVSLSTPDGNVSLGENKNYTADELGIDPYPGATTSTGGMNVNTDKGSMVTAVYETDDPADKVVSFYKGKTNAGEQSFMEMGTTAMITFKKAEKDVVIVSINSDTAQHKGKTQISITHSKDK